jgi:hypothetical protein
VSDVLTDLLCDELCHALSHAPCDVGNHVLHVTVHRWNIITAADAALSIARLCLLGGWQNYQSLLVAPLLPDYNPNAPLYLCCLLQPF